MQTDRANAICILEILKKYSDLEHILSMKDLLLKLQLVYDMKIDRRTVYSAIALLEHLGYDISTYEENGVGYFLRSRDFETAEILLLADAVYAFPFIPAKQSEQLVAKLQQQLSCHQMKQHKNLMIVKTDRKTDNQQVFWNIECLDEAISLGCKVRFTYLRRNTHLQFEPRREKPYVVSPYRMVYTNQRYYLACGYKSHTDTSFYRLDRMKDIHLLKNQPIEGNLVESEINHSIYAFTGKPEQILVRCNKTFLDDVVDHFGSDLTIFKENDDMVTVRFLASPRGVKFWAQQYLSNIELLEPIWLRQEILENLRENPYLR